jgi:hypothetical protein
MQILHPFSPKKMEIDFRQLGCIGLAFNWPMWEEVQILKPIFSM